MEGDELDRVLGDIEASAAMGELLDDESWSLEVQAAEFARTPLADRLRDSAHVRVRVTGVESIDGRIAEVGDSSLLIESVRWWIVPLDSVEWVQGVSSRRASATDRVTSLASMLRRWVGDDVVVHLSGGGVVSGTLTRVGVDHADVHDHVIPLARLAAVSRRPD